jgi:hypothetical protein
MLSLVDESEHSFPLINFDRHGVCSMENMASQGSKTLSPIPYGKFWRASHFGVRNYFGLILGRKPSHVG